MSREIAADIQGSGHSHWRYLWGTALGAAVTGAIYYRYHSHDPIFFAR